MANQVNKNSEIHPLINTINISDKVKRYFTKLEFYEIIADHVGPV